MPREDSNSPHFPAALALVKSWSTNRIDSEELADEDNLEELEARSITRLIAAAVAAERARCVTALVDEAVSWQVIRERTEKGSIASQWVDAMRLAIKLIDRALDVDEAIRQALITRRVLHGR